MIATQYQGHLDGGLIDSLANGHTIVHATLSGPIFAAVSSPTSDGITGEFDIHVYRLRSDPAGFSCEAIAFMSADEAEHCSAALKTCAERVHALRKQADEILAMAELAVGFIREGD